MTNLDIILQIHNILWGMPLVLFILGIGVVLSIQLKGLQFTKLKKAFSFLGKKEKTNGEVSTFQALCISLSATIGTGNITAVATAITIGGPGALFWMVITAFLQMAIKYAEGFLAIKYRRWENKRLIGGPYAYIEYGLGKKWKPLAKIFAFFGMLASILGLGTLTQINGIVDASKNIFDKESLTGFIIGHLNVSWCNLFVGLLVSILAGVVLIGGVKRIAKVCEWLVPIMGLIYISICLLLIIYNMEKLPLAIKSILQMALSTKALVASIAGITLQKVITQGVVKGIFSNEAGLGSAPIAISMVKSNDPVKEGLVAMTSTFIGTIIICMLTGIVVVITGVWQNNLSGIMIAEAAFSIGLPFSSFFSAILLFVCIIFFAFTTIIGWNLYGIRCLDYLCAGKIIYQKLYNWVYIFMIFMGAFLQIEFIWNLTEILNALMCIPNLTAIFFLRKEIAQDTKAYFKK